MRLRSFKPREHVLDVNGVKWRGGVVWAIDGADATIRVQTERSGSAVRNFAVATADLPCAAVGAPIVARVEGDNPDAMTIEEMRGSVFASNYSPGSDQAGAVARGQFYPGLVTPREGADWGTWWEG